MQTIHSTRAISRSITARCAAGLAVAALGVAACGGSDDGGSAKSDAVTFFIEFAATEDLELDKSCVETAVDALSEADAKTLGDLDAETFGESETDPGFSEEIDVVGDRVFDTCVIGES